MEMAAQALARRLLKAAVKQGQNDGTGERFSASNP